VGRRHCLSHDQGWTGFGFVRFLLAPVSTLAKRANSSSILCHVGTGSWDFCRSYFLPACYGLWSMLSVHAFPTLQTCFQSC
jgi:hypothetical protein